MMLKGLLLGVAIFCSLPSIAAPSHAYADAVLGALQKKGLLSKDEVIGIKQQAVLAEKSAVGSIDSSQPETVARIKSKVSKKASSFKV